MVIKIRTYISRRNVQNLVGMKNNDIGDSYFTNHIFYFGDVYKEKFLGPERVKILGSVR